MAGVSRVNRQVHAWFCERLEVKFLRLTRCLASCRPFRSSAQRCVKPDLSTASRRHIINNLSGSNCIPFTEHEHAIHNVRRVMKTEQHRRRSIVGQLSEGRELNIESATASYEGWMRSCTAVVSSDLRSKHEQMKESPFQFLTSNFPGTIGALTTGGETVAAAAACAYEFELARPATRAARLIRRTRVIALHPQRLPGAAFRVRSTRESGQLHAGDRAYRPAGTPRETTPPAASVRKAAATNPTADKFGSYRPQIPS